MDFAFKSEIRVIFWLPILLVLLGTGGICDRVEFFREKDYTGYIDEYELSGEEGGRCHSFESDTIAIKSLKTDRCLMLFSQKGCDVTIGVFYVWGPANSLRVDNDTSEIADTLNEGDTQIVHSFGTCSRERGGGPEVDVDFYYRGNYNSQAQNSYRDVCSCRPLKEDSYGGVTRQISVDNHGHAIDLFEGEHCTGQMRSVRAGSYFDTKWMWDPRDGKAVFDVRSFRPSNMEKCIKLSATIYKFEFEDGSQDMINNSTEETVKLATDSFLRNNGSQSMVQEYSVNEKVAETVEVTRSTGYSNMETVKVEESGEISATTGVPFMSEQKVTAKITNSFQYQRTDSGSFTNKTVVTNEEVVTVRQQISIQPCRECVASTFVKKVKNYPIKYRAYSRVSGTAGVGGAKMTAGEVRLALRQEVKYLQDHDAFTVDTMVEGVMYAEYGLNTLVNVDCKQIYDCVAKPPNPVQTDALSDH